jgi:excisionase family DNA binding protein
MEAADAAVNLTQTNINTMKSIQTNKPGLTIKQAAESVGRSDQTVRDWIKNKKVAATLIDGKYFIDDESLEEHRRRLQGNLPEPSRFQKGETPAPSDGAVTHQPADEAKTVQNPETAPLPTASVRSVVRTPEIMRSNARDTRAPKKKKFERRKKVRKGPLKYAKDVMRKFNVDQLLDVRGWIDHRVDAQTRES